MYLFECAGALPTRGDDHLLPRLRLHLHVIGCSRHCSSELDCRSVWSMYSANKYAWGLSMWLNEGGSVDGLRQEWRGTRGDGEERSYRGPVSNT
jgi:hypothetical protein